MTGEDFVKVLRKVIYKGSVRGAIRLLEAPPGRSPSSDLVELSTFYKSLTVEHKELLERIVDLSCEETLFGMLCVLDGVRAIENGEEKGELLLHYKKGKTKILLNDPEGEFLHDMFFDETAHDA